MYYTIHDQQYEGWHSLMSFVRKKYKEEYDAEIYDDPEYYIAVYSDNNLKNFLGGAGITFAENKLLFSEQYLSDSIDCILNKKLITHVHRMEVAEISALTSFKKSTGIKLVKKVPFLAQCLGEKYLLCTVT